MAYQPFPIQVEAHRALLLDNYKRAIIYWSRRTGKTAWAIQQLMLSCILNQGEHFMVYKEYTQAEQVAWPEFQTKLPKVFINESAINKSTLTFTFHYFGNKDTGEVFPVTMPDGTKLEIMQDHDMPPSTIRLLGSDKADSHRGKGAQGLLFDEYQDQDDYGWDFVYKYFLATTGGWAAFMGTAKDDDRWNNMLDRAEKRYLESPRGYLPDSTEEDDPVNSRWYYSKATWRNNPHVKPEWIASERKTAEEDGKLGSFLQETELIPFTQQGAVYPMFTKKLHVVKPSEVPQEGTDYIALDFGFAQGHPMAACFIRITRDDVWYQWDEIHATGVQLDDAIAEIRQKMGGRLITGIVADSARPDLIDYMASKGFPMIASPKKQNSIVSGIELLRVRLKPKTQIIGDPKPNYYVTNNCRGTIYDWTHYRYREFKNDRHPSETPEKRYDDSLDAIRYLALWFKYGMAKDEKIPEQSTMKSMNEYGLL